MDRTGVNPFDVTVRIVSLLLSSSGEGVVMLERYAGRVSRAYDLDVEFVVLPDQLVITQGGGGTATRVALVRAMPGLSRIDQVMDLKVLVADIEAGLTADEAALRLDTLDRAAPRWPPWLRVVGVVLFTAGFAPSVVATGPEVVATLILGALMGVLLVTFEGHRFELLVPFVGGFTLTLVAATLLPDLVSRSGVVLVVIPALFVVVPGDYLSAAASELVTGRITAGSVRLIYAAFILALLTVGIALAVELTGNEKLLHETSVTPTLPFLAVVLAWVPFSIGIVLAFNGYPRAIPWLIPTVIGTFLLQQGTNRLVGDITGTLVAGIALGAVANLAARPTHRPPRLILMLGGFFVLTVGGLGLRGATALLGRDLASGFADLGSFLIQMPTVAIALTIGVLLTEGRGSRRPVDQPASGGG